MKTEIQNIKSIDNIDYNIDYNINYNIDYNTNFIINNKNYNINNLPKEIISIGNLNTSIVHPREVFETEEMTEELKSFKDKKLSLVKRGGAKIKSIIKGFYEGK